METVAAASAMQSLAALRILFIGGYYRVLMDPVRTYLCTLQDLGADVVEYCTDQHRDMLDFGTRPYDCGSYGPVYVKWEGIRSIMEQHQPHLVVCCAGGLGFYPEVAAEIRKTSCLVGIAMSDPDMFLLTTSVIARSFDHFFTNHLGTVERHRKEGANAYWLPFACYPKFHYRRLPDPRFVCDVIVIGDAREDRAELVMPLRDAVKVKVFGGGWEKFGIEALNINMAAEGLIGSAFSSATIGLDFARNVAGLAIAKLRLVEIAGSGCIPCTEYSEEIPHLFDDSEILTFRTVPEMVEKIRRVIGEPGVVAALQRNTFWRIHSQHTVEHRWRFILEKCGVRV